MLVITRKTGESVVIGDNIEITVLDSTKDKIKLGINAPSDVRVKRKEVIVTEQSNRIASEKLPDDVLKTIIDSNKKGCADYVNK